MKRVQLILAIAIGSILMLTSCSNYNRISYSKVGKKDKVVQVEREVNQLTEEITLAHSESSVKDADYIENLEEGNQIEKELIEQKSIDKRGVFLQLIANPEQKRNVKEESIRFDKKERQTSFNLGQPGRKSNVRIMAEWSMVLGIIGVILPFGNLAGLILGILFLRRTNPGDSGRGLAIAGIILNALFIAAKLFFVIGYAAGF